MLFSYFDASVDLKVVCCCLRRCKNFRSD